MVADISEHLFWIVVYHLILKAKHDDALCLKVRLAFGIVRLAKQVVVVRTVQLDRKFFAGQ